MKRKHFNVLIKEHQIPFHWNSTLIMGLINHDATFWIMFFWKDYLFNLMQYPCRNVTNNLKGRKFRLHVEALWRYVVKPFLISFWKSERLQIQYPEVLSMLYSKLNVFLLCKSCTYKTIIVS
jgi:hypothetical protein